MGKRRAEALRAASADVVVIDPNPSQLPDGLHALHEPFTAHHLDNAFLVVVATDSPTVNELVIRAARERRVLVNAAAPGTGPDTGDFAVMATLRRGPLTVGVSGGGPGVAKVVRDRIDACLEPWLGDWARLMDATRAKVQETVADESGRRSCMRALVDSQPIRECVASGQMVRASELIDELVAQAAGALTCRT